MMQKTCTRCQESKLVGEFYSQPAGKHGVESVCRLCRKMQRDAWYKENKDSVNTRASRWRADNPQKAIEASRRFEDANRDKRNCARQSPESRVRSHKKWAKANPEKLREIWRRKGEARRNCPKRALEAAMRSNIHRGIKQGSKAGRRSTLLVGYTIDQLVAHLESQFVDGMTWANRGVSGWHIDHIKPLASFDYETPDCPSFKAAWALTNLQPLWARDNMSKGAKFHTPPIASRQAA